jgi:hypothetical protein
MRPTNEPDFRKMYHELQLAVCPESNIIDTRPYEIVQEKALKKVAVLQSMAEELHELKKTLGKAAMYAMLCVECGEPLYDAQNRCIRCRPTTWMVPDRGW